MSAMDYIISCLHYLSCSVVNFEAKMGQSIMPKGKTSTNYTKLRPKVSAWLNSFDWMKTFNIITLAFQKNNQKTKLFLILLLRGPTARQWARQLLQSSRCKRRKPGSGSLGKGWGLCQAPEQNRQAHAVQARTAQTTWRKEVLSPFLRTACSAIPNTQRDTSSTDRPGRWHALLMDARTHSQANPIYACKQKAKNKLFFLATIGTSWNGGGSVCPGGMRAQSKPKPSGAIWHSETPHYPKLDPKGERGCLSDQDPSITPRLATFPGLCQELELRGKQRA